MKIELRRNLERTFRNAKNWHLGGNSGTILMGSIYLKKPARNFETFPSLFAGMIQRIIRQPNLQLLFTRSALWNHFLSSCIPPVTVWADSRAIEYSWQFFPLFFSLVFRRFVPVFPSPISLNHDIQFNSVYKLYKFKQLESQSFLVWCWFIIKM